MESSAGSAGSACSATLPECSLCRCPTGESEVGIQPGERWCSDYCLDLATKAGWKLGCKKNPREIYFEKYPRETPECCLCTSPKLVHISSYCPGCDNLFCGKCVIDNKNNTRTCPKCDHDRYDYGVYFAAFSNKNLSIKKRRICGRIIYGLGIQEGMNLEEHLDLCISLGDLQCRYKRLGNRKQPYGYAEYLEYYHLAIMGHPLACREVSDFWYENKFDVVGPPELLDIKCMYWTEMAAGVHDGLSLSRLGQEKLLHEDDDGFLHDLRLSAENNFVTAYGILGNFWVTKKNDAMARRSYYQGIEKGCHLSDVMIGIYQAEGKIGIRKNPLGGFKRVFNVLKLSSTIGDIHRAVVKARTWIASVYYGKHDIGVVIPGIEPDLKLALDLLDIGIKIEDGSSTILKAKIMIYEKLIDIPL